MIRTLSLAALMMTAAAPAQAALSLCNRTSYVTDVAVGQERGATVATRGWFRIEPGQCKQVIDDVLDGGALYVSTRTLPFYGKPPQARASHGEFCVGSEASFNIPNARNCGNTVPFTAIKPNDNGSGPVANLAEEADYDPTQARLAGIQRLLVIAGYDATPIDGVTGAKTTAAIAKFLNDRSLPPDAANDPGFFDRLIAAAQRPDGPGFSWCNDTQNPVMAAVGANEGNSTVTRGWYRVEPGQCVRPDMRGAPGTVYSYAEAVDRDNHALTRNGNKIAWGGDAQFCTRDGAFEITNQKDCAARGLNQAGFATVAVPPRAPATVRFTDQ